MWNCSNGIYWKQIHWRQYHISRAFLFCDTWIPCHTNQRCKISVLIGNQLYIHAIGTVSSCWQSIYAFFQNGATSQINTDGVHKSQLENSKLAHSMFIVKNGSPNTISARDAKKALDLFKTSYIFSASILFISATALFHSIRLLFLYLMRKSTIFPYPFH